MFFSNGRIALITDDDKDYQELSESYKTIGWKLDRYHSEGYDKVVNSNGKYEVVLIDFKLGGGLLSVEIAKLLIKRGYAGKVFLLAGRSMSMEMYEQRYGTVLMKDAVKSDPERIFDGEVDIQEQLMDAVFIQNNIVRKGGF